MNRNTTEPDWTIAPIRTYDEVVRAMRKQGDLSLTRSMVHWYEQSAIRKLREGLKDLEGEVGR